MDTSNGTAEICPSYLDTHGPDSWGDPRWDGRKPEITGPRAQAIREKRTWEALGELATWATEEQFAADIAGELVPFMRLARLFGERAFELTAAGRLVACCLATADVARRRRGQDGFRAPLPVIAARCGLSTRHTRRTAGLVAQVVALLKASGVGVQAAPDFERRRAACSRRGNAYALSWPAKNATQTQTVRASGTETSAHASLPAFLSAAAEEARATTTSDARANLLPGRVSSVGQPDIRFDLGRQRSVTSVPAVRRPSKPPGPTRERFELLEPHPTPAQLAAAERRRNAYLSRAPQTSDATSERAAALEPYPESPSAPVDRPTTATVAVGPARRQDETRQVAGGLRTGQVSDYRASLVEQLDAATDPTVREFLEERIATHDREEMRRATYGRKEPR